MRLSEVAQATRGILLGPDLDFTGVSIDTRSIRAGETFIALKGPNFDGHDYVARAQEAGARASVVERKLENLNLSQVVVGDTYQALREIAVHARQMFKGKVAAITGSCGKTTVKGMLREICEHAGGCVATKGNLNNLIGVPLSLTRLNNDVEFAVIEAGTSVPGEIPKLARLINADVALVNNVMPSHVEGFGSVDNIALEKTELYAALSSTDIAVINLDDERADYFVERSLHAKKIGFSVSGQLRFTSQFIETITADNISHTDKGAPVFTLKLRDKNETCHLRVLGEHNVTNALAAAAMAVAMGIETDDILKGLEAFSGENRRMQIRKGLKGETVIDDTYNASPGSVKAAIDYLKNFNNSILVLGDMGELGVEASTAHREIGQYAKEAGIGAMYATGLLASETANTFGAGAIWCESQTELVEKLNELEMSGVIVLVKGSRFTRMDKVVDALCQQEGEK